MTNSLNNMNQEKLINIHNVSINYTDNGSWNSSVIFLIHGFPFNKTIWNNQVILLQKKYRVITYDVNGHDTEMNVISIGLFVKDLIGLMDALSIKKATLCGLSMGGYFTLNAIENYPKRFEGLILCDEKCITESQINNENSDKSNLKNNKQESQQNDNKCFNSILESQELIKRKEEIAEIRKMIRCTTLESLNQSMKDEIAAQEIRKETAEIKVPVLILEGEKDKIKPLSFSQMMHEKTKKSYLKIIEHARNINNLNNSKYENEHFSSIVSLMYNNAM